MMSMTKNAGMSLNQFGQKKQMKICFNYDRFDAKHQYVLYCASILYNDQLQKMS